MSIEFNKEGVRAWLGRVCVLFIGIPLGWLCAFGAVVLLFWNEGRAVKTGEALKEGAIEVASIGSDRIASAYAGRLVHVQGLVTTDEHLRDPLFGVSVHALRLKRSVETYQWRERAEQRSGQTPGKRDRSTTYSYDLTWSADLIDSSTFHQPQGHQNPTVRSFPSAEWTVKRFRLGSFQLEPALHEQLRHFAPCGVRVSEPPGEASRAGFRALTASFYRGADPMHPQVGDIRVVYETVSPAEVSIIAGQNGANLGAYRTKSGGDLRLLSIGTISAAEMLQSAAQWNRILTWLLRVGGFLLMLVGFRLALGPLATLDLLLPGLFAGLSMLTGFLTFLLAAALTLVVTSFAWLTYRPSIGLPLLAAGLLLAVLTSRSCSNRLSAPCRQTDG